MLFNDEFQLSLICVAGHKMCFNREWSTLHVVKGPKKKLKDKLSLSGFEPLASRICGEDHNVMI